VAIDAAYSIAQPAIIDKQQQQFPNFKFEPIKFISESALWWEFGANSEDLIQQGHVPGGIRVSVDKLDGHIWKLQDQLRLYGEEYYLESATNLEPKQVLHLFSQKFGFEWSKDSKHKNQVCLKGKALIIGAFKHSFPLIVEKTFGFRPNLHIWFRIIPYKKGYELASLVMLQAVMSLFTQDTSDAVLVFDAGNLITVLQRASGQISLDECWNSWSETEIEKIMLPYKKDKLLQSKLLN
jgi:hypothetical protein